MSYYRQKHRSANAELDMTPMLDIVFIMLIFFIVTTSFVKESGVEVNSPEAQSVVKQDNNTIMVAITEQGDVWVDKRLVDVRSVRTIVARLYSQTKDGTVVIQSDENARTRDLVAVMDQIKLAGIDKIAIAASPSQGNR